ncbi:MAG TPA: hypothetical protein VG755_16040 [Nannocystaceae bacterium]|nr:hypothetical protein [Nannocystaceae bacterium]
MFARYSLLVAALALAGCPRDQDTPPENDTSTSNASNDTSGSATLTTTTAPTTTQGTEESGPSPDTGSGSESTSGGEECLGDNDCWNCAPTQPEQVLNHCTNADCEPFANTPERLPLLERDGSLPPIP